MGAGVAVQEPYEFSFEDENNNNNNNNNSGIGGMFTWKSRRRTLSTASSDSSIQQQQQRIEPVRINYLDVPYIDRHPFQDYRFGKKLGEGSFSVVFKAHPQGEGGGRKKRRESRRGRDNKPDEVEEEGEEDDAGEPVAIKEVSLSLLSRQQATSLTNEMNILSQLKHDSIVTLHSVYSSGEKKFLVMEYLGGGQLLTAICAREFYHESDAKQILWQLASALVYLQERCVIHRDIKPENIILATPSPSSSSSSLTVKLVDFGFATIETEATRQPSKQLVGSPGYFAPEVLKDRSYSTKCDLWSLGVVLYIILSGLMPFSTETADEHRILLGEFCFPTSRFLNVSEEAKDLIRRMLVVNSSKRFSARDVLNHPWMKLPISPSSPSHAGTHHHDVDISSNLEFIRQHHASKKFNLAGMLFGSLSPTKRRSLSGPSSSDNHHSNNNQRESVTPSSPSPLIRSSSENLPGDANLKLIRLSSAIGNHNAALD